MADGDEKIDHNDRVLVRNRVVDAPTEVMFNGIVLTWKAGETRSIQRLEAVQVVEKSVVLRDPTFTDPSVFKLVVVNELGEAVEDGTSAEPLTLAECKELAKYGSLNTRNLPADRLIGGMMLADEEGNRPRGLQVLNSAGVLERDAREQSRKNEREALMHEIRADLVKEIREQLLAELRQPEPSAS